MCIVVESSSLFHAQILKKLAKPRDAYEYTEGMILLYNHPEL